jgi:hypothetical protein
MNFAIYMVGVLLVVAALAWGATRLGLGSTWIAIGVLVLLGLGMMGGVVKTRHRDPS